MDEYSVFQIFLLTSRQKKRKRALFHDSLLEEDCWDHQMEEENNEMVNNIAAIVGVLEDKPPRKIRVAD